MRIASLIQGIESSLVRHHLEQSDREAALFAEDKDATHEDLAHRSSEPPLLDGFRSCSRAPTYCARWLQPVLAKAISDILDKVHSYLQQHAELASITLAADQFCEDFDAAPIFRDRLDQLLAMYFKAILS